MISFIKATILVGLVAFLACQNSQVGAASSLMPNVCNAGEETAMPCVCCKKACWFGIAEMTTAYFGHMPGERSDAEAKFTLAMMNQCFKLECNETCATAH
ncbi:neuronal small secreted protein [Caenorhabditis elegans]|uniref:Neuronal small secreted protein n=1 Tax=Caenorhabditis elegans TaxID=6239 RepID=Q17776_CAEEL|nr:Uncharacterized protein CELE_C07B5.3 [Caenorhabditis elegans]CAA86410.1 Uncharacterized protein CELE_C07B5.3 [Caenorhabditis elegans]|eukprot:NP_509602.1 Uncharacterized protein CELE_C07B5.3 [Caenorhabditis elegans]